MSPAKPASPRRVAAFRRGLSAETGAVLLLAAKGYWPLARRFKRGVGEVDLIVRRGRLIAFVEVKARGALDDAAEAVAPRQRRRIVAGAKAWLASHPAHAGYDLRFDAVLISPGQWPRHIKSAFEAEA